MPPTVVAVNRPQSRQKARALIVLSLSLAGILLLYHFHREAWLPALGGFLFGYILQRSRFCFAAGFRDIFMIRSTALTRSILLVFLLTTAGFTLVHFLTEHTIVSGGKVYPVGWHTLVGGLIFGFGMVMAGNCVSGCLMRMGEGYLMQWFTFAGLLAGSAAGAWHLGWWHQVSIQRSPALFLPHHLGWFLSLALQFALIAALYLVAFYVERAHFPRPGLRSPLRALFKAVKGESLRRLFLLRSWPYPLGAAALALVNTLLFYAWGQPWGITGGLTHLAGWLCQRLGLPSREWFYFQKIPDLQNYNFFLEQPLVYLAAAMVAGSLFSSLLHREFRLRRPRSYKYVFSGLGGGLLMGYSSRVAMGCNIGGLLGGIASLSLHGWLFALAILGGAYLGGKFFLRYLT